MEELIGRIEQIMKSLNKRRGELADMLEIDRSNFSQIMNGKRPVGDNMLNRFTIHLNINKHWLATGEGEMFNTPAPSDAGPAKGGNFMLVPIVQQYAYAGYLGGYSDPEYIGDLPTMPFLVDHEYKGHYLCFEVRGVSMDDGSKNSYLQGDIVLAREIKPEYWKSRLHLNTWTDFVIVHRTDGILVKQITEHDVEKGCITIHSLNPLYPDKTLELQDIQALFNIVKAVRNK